MSENNTLKTPAIWARIADAITHVTGTPFHPETVADLGGGCINRAVRLSDRYRSFFVKLNEPALKGMFEAERDGLEALAVPDGPRVPAPLAVGTTEGAAFLVLEFIPLTSLAGESWARLGEQLAAVHRHTAAEFGWHRSNTIGATPQINDWTPKWVDFWREQRLGYQLKSAADNGLDDATVRRGGKLLERLDGLFADHDPLASLLHGDLWSGNVAADEAGNPVLFDPAVYYGDRECDIAMSELFGRVGPGFYDAYGNAWPLDPGYGARRTLYNLYHVLNHFNLFGGGYAGQVDAMIDRLLGLAG